VPCHPSRNYVKFIHRCIILYRAYNEVKLHAAAIRIAIHMFGVGHSILGIYPQISVARHLPLAVKTTLFPQMRDETLSLQCALHKTIKVIMFISLVVYHLILSCFF